MQRVAGLLAKGAMWVIATRVLVNLLGLASTLLLARLLMPDDFGLVAIATTISAVLASITELSLAQALVQHQAPQAAHFDTAWTLNALRALVLAAMTALAAEPIAAAYADSRLASILYVTSVGTVIGGVASPKVVLYTRRLVFWQDFVINVSQKLVGFVVSVFIALVWQSYWALVAGVLATQVVAVVVSYILAPYRPRASFIHAQDLFSFSVWLSLGQAVNTLNWRSDQLAVGYLLGNAPLGHYTVGDNLASLPTREATAPVAQTLFPAFSRIADDPARLRAAYMRAQNILCAIALPAGFGFAAIARPLTELALGEKWAPAIPVMQALSCIFALQSLSSMLQPLAMAQGETRRLFLRDLINLCVRLPLVAIGLLAGGFAGLIAARCVSGTMGMAINMKLVRDLLGIPVHVQIGGNWRALTACAVMVAAVLFVDIALDGVARSDWWLSIEVAAMMVTGMVTYAATTYGLWRWAGAPLGVEREALDALRGILGKSHRPTKA